MKTVMISIHPYWVEKILSGEKTLEIRISAPKVPTGEPLRCLIYETKAGGGAGAVVGEFESPKRHWFKPGDIRLDWERLSCVGTGAQLEYMNRAGAVKLIGWEIAGARKYREAKSVREYGLKCPPMSYCNVKEEEQ